MNTAQTQEEKQITYNNYVFQKQNDYWITRKNNLDLIFRYNPLEIQEINNIESLNLNNYYNKILYLYSESDDAKREIYNNLHPQNNEIVKRMQTACLNSSDEYCSKKDPIKNCNQTGNFIIIKESDTTEINKNQNCIFIKSPRENLTKTTDEYLFNLFEIR